jgi:hypothetical protein
MSTFTKTQNFGSLLQGLCGKENYDRLNELKQKPPEKSGGQNNNADSVFSKPPKSDGDDLHPILSGSPNLHKQKGDPMSEESINDKELIEIQNDDSEFRIEEEELPDHHWRTEIPNIVLKIGLSPIELAVYIYLKSTAGDSGECWKSIASLSKECGVGETKLKECLKRLSDPILSGTPLIRVKRRKKKDGSFQSNVILIVPIWRKNGDFFRDKKRIKENSTQSPGDPGGGSRGDPGGSPNDHKEERKEEEPYKKKTNRSNTDSTSNSSSFFDRADALDSSFYNKKKEDEDDELDQQTKNKIDFLWKFIEKQNMACGKTTNNKPGIKKSDIKAWIKKYEPIEIMDCLKRAIKAEISKTYAGYVTQLLKDQVTMKEVKIEEGRKYVEKVVNKEKMNSYIEMQKTGFKIKGDKNESVSYTLPHQTLHGILENAWKIHQSNRL